MSLKEAKVLPKTLQIQLSGSSMQPMACNNDHLDIQVFKTPRDLHSFEVGQTVLIRPDQEWVVHRIVLREGSKFTKGDWSLFFDKKTQVWGTVKAINGRPSDLLMDPFIGKLSAKITDTCSPLKRKFLKLKLGVYVYFKRLSYGALRAENKK